jgi:hypothetical protein
MILHALWETTVTEYHMTPPLHFGVQIVQPKLLIININSYIKENLLMKKIIIFFLVLVPLLLNVFACNTDTSLNEKETIIPTNTQNSTEKETIIDTDTQKPTEKETQGTNTQEPPICYPDVYYDTVVVHYAPVEEFLSQIDLNDTGKLAKYSTDIASVLLQNGFSEPREIVYDRGLDDKGNYRGFEALALTYHDPECPNDTHGTCVVMVDLRIFQINPVSTDNRVMIKEAEEIEIYKHVETTSYLRTQYLLKIGEYVACYVSVSNTATEEKTENLLDQLTSVAASVRNDLLDIAPELITIS